VVIICSVDPTRVVPDDSGLTRKEWLAFCQERGLVAFAALVSEELVGFVAAESDPHAVHILVLEGDTQTCRLLLDRMVMLAGERDVSGWVPISRGDVQQMAERLGFVRMAEAEPGGRPSYFFYWSRNGDV
jgi:hypothetical protein